MRGYERQKAIMDLVTQRRRAAIDALNGAVALDLADLVARLDQGNNAQYSPVIRHRLMLRGLLTVWPNRDQIAGLLGLDLAELDRLTTLPLMADPDLAVAIVDQARLEIAETPEPGRFVAPRI